MSFEMERIAVGARATAIQVRFPCMREWRGRLFALNITASMVLALLVAWSAGLLWFIAGFAMLTIFAIMFDIDNVWGRLTKWRRG